jgi:glycosyltransferase involved in cell wall biosynthesis
MAKICLITPGHLSTNPRLVKEADALTEVGHDVRVIAADFALWAAEADKTFIDRAWQIVATLRFGPYASPGVRVLHAVRQRAARMAIAAGLRNQRIREASFHPLTADLISAALRVPADLYIAHYPAALPAAALAAQNYRSAYAYDAEDYHLGDLPMVPQHDADRETIRSIEGRYLKQCAYVTAASPGIADAYVQTYGIERPTVVLNVFPKSQAPAGATAKGTAKPGPSIYWFSQTIGPDRGLECAVAAIARARSRPHLYLRGTAASSYSNRLRAIANKSGVADRLHFLAPAPPAEMEQLASAYDVGFCGETGHTPNREIALTNKLFSFVLAGIPTLASAIPAHVALAGELGTALHIYPINDDDRLAAALDALLGNSNILSSARAAAFALGQSTYNWDVQKNTLLSCLKATVASRSPPPRAASTKLKPARVH